MSNEHRYQVQGRWTRDREGFVQAPGIAESIEFAAPPEFKGEGGKWTPEHFLVAAVASCFVVTFRAIAEMSKVEFLDLDLEAEGVLKQEQSGWRFAEITLSPTVTLVHEQDRELALKGLKKAHNGCLIGRGLAFPVTMEPTVRVPEMLPAEA